MADTTFIDNAITAANRVVAAWLNAANNFVYRGSRPTYAITTGTANVYVLTLPGGSLYAAATDGDTFLWKAHQTNTAAATFSVVGSATTTPTAIQINGAALAGGEIVSGVVYEVTKVVAGHGQLKGH